MSDRPDATGEMGEPYVPIYVQPEPNAAGRLWAKGVLKRGLKIGAEVHREFEMQAAITKDLLEAEFKAGTSTPLNFNAVVMCRQLLSIGTFKGPFTIGLIETLPSGDFRKLREAQSELDLMGEL